MNVLEYPNKFYASGFGPDDLVIWHDCHGSQCLPIPAVVVRQLLGSILIRVRVDGAIKEAQVNPDELVGR